MTEKENILEIIKFGKFCSIPGHIPELALYYFGCNHDNFEGQGHHSPIGTSWNDIWGVTWYREVEGVMGIPIKHPITDLLSLDRYKPPDIDDERYYGLIFEPLNGVIKDNIFITGSHRDTLWERAYMLVGMEDLMCYFYTEPVMVKALLKMIMDFQLNLAKYYIKAGVEIVHLSDDLGTQSSLLISREIIEEFLVPEYRRLIEFYKKHGVIINFHSCGHIEPIIDIFIDVGVDILNPIQATANNLSMIHRAAKGKMTLMGGISSAVVMDGTPEEIENEVRNAINLLGCEGGYICCVDQHLPFKEENINALHDAVERYGGIPFDLRLPVKPRGYIDMSEAEFNAKIEKAFTDAQAGKDRLASEFFSELERKYSL